MLPLRLAVPLGLLAASLPAQTANAQLEVPGPQLVGQSQSQIPQLIRDTKPATYAAYLRKFLMKMAPTESGNRELVTAVKVAADINQANAGEAWLLHYAVPPMSTRMRLPETYPTDGRLQGELRAVLAQDEYEPASFVAFPLADIESVQVRIGALRTEGGANFPADALDLTVVKVWYQNGNAWYSYFQDVGNVLVPELLLHDENLIRVDTAKQANYARIGRGATAREVWLNQPYKIDSGFDPINPGFTDAAQLQPVRFQTGQGKQFVLTAHATPDTTAGTYRGNIQLSAAGRKDVSIPVAITVLPFQLPSPRANFDPKREIPVSLMGSWPRTPPDHPATLATLQNLRRHNLLNPPLFRGTAPTPELESNVRLYKQVGFATNTILGAHLPANGFNGRPPLAYEELKKMEKVTQVWRDFYRKDFPEADIVATMGDEQGPRWFMTHRPVWRLAHENGLKTNIAGHNKYDLTKAGYALDYHETAGAPSDKDHSAPWNQLGARTGFYANQHNGSENPDFVRRQHGLLGYLNNYEMVNNYEFAYGPWNDFGTELYKPMVLAYPTYNGLVDTLEWEGFREGIDDIRYASQLRLLAAEAAGSGNLDREIEARKCWLWLAQLNGETMDLDQVRQEIIEKILRLQALKGGVQ